MLIAINSMTTSLQTAHLKRIAADINSSMISYLEYSQEEHKMYVKFKRGRYKGKLREYPEVLPNEFFGLLSSQSIGRAVLTYLQSRKSV